MLINIFIDISRNYVDGFSFFSFTIISIINHLILIINFYDSLNRNVSI